MKLYILERTIPLTQPSGTTLSSWVVGVFSTAELAAAAGRQAVEDYAACLVESSGGPSKSHRAGTACVRECVLGRAGPCELVDLPK